ncbi:hypothetical protein [Nonlabens ponticola]|uniref:Uncharacterized protein n=1 Tax=Nonlabens ponticola TaxID=2496866 RepID=A0A3S9MUB8_9FLAO|nr:hypothetical protein [Nonlabens ponticola]AZQ42761.1 hypothetical protein EJ995_00370 [Nonlabens ponticola]
MNEKKQRKLNKWQNHLDITTEFIDYSQKRMDILIISLGSGTLYVIFETLKGLKEIETNSESIEFPNILLSSGIFIGLSIISNFISQYTSLIANKNEKIYVECTICEIEDGCLDQDDVNRQKIADKKSKAYNKATTIFNLASIITLCVGIALLGVFYFLTF